jgi:hypothetical protein
VSLSQDTWFPKIPAAGARASAAGTFFVMALNRNMPLC